MSSNMLSSASLVIKGKCALKDRLEQLLLRNAVLQPVVLPDSEQSCRIRQGDDKTQKWIEWQVVQQIEGVMRAISSDPKNRSEEKKKVKYRDVTPSIPLYSKKIRKYVQQSKLYALVHACHRSGTFMTLRDVFYRDPVLFESQKISNRLIERTTTSMGIHRDALHVHASSRALLQGPITIFQGSTSSLCSLPTPIPTLWTRDIRLETSALAVLVVEKEAMLQSMVQSGFAERWNMVLMTSLGFPTRAAKRCIRVLYETHHLSCFVLTDADPYGMDIAWQYVRQPNVEDQKGNPYWSPSVHWLGCWPSEWDTLSLPEEAKMTLTEKDHVKLNALEKVVPDAWRDEISCFRGKGCKAEFQSVYDRFGSWDEIMEGWLMEKWIEKEWK